MLKFLEPNMKDHVYFSSSVNLMSLIIMERVWNEDPIW